MQHPLAANPVARRLTARHRWPSLPVIMLVGTLAAAGTLPVILYHMLLYSPERLRQPALIVWVITGAIIVLSPGVAAALSALLTHHLTGKTHHQLLKVSTLPRLSLVQAHIAATVAQLRLLLAVVVGLTPAVVAGTIYYTNVFFHRTMKVTRYYHMMYDLPTPVLQNIRYRVNMLGWQPEFYAWAASLLGVMLLAMVIGVGAAYRIRARSLAALAAACVALLAGAMLLGLVPLLPLDQAAPGVHVVAVPLIALLPYGLAWGGLRWLRRWA